MKNKFQNKYRIPSARKPNWDYGWAGAYFITICVKDMQNHHFGKVINGQMQLTDIGKLAEQYWYEIPQHFNDIELGAFVVMPNHVHGILVLTKNANVAVLPTVSNTAAVSNTDGLTDVDVVPITGGLTDAGGFVETLHATSLHHPKRSAIHNDITNSQYMSRISPKPHTVSNIIRAYKSALTKNARPLNPHFQWQARFYDIIIRNNTAYQNITEYIHNNPAKWQADKFNVRNR